MLFFRKHIRSIVLAISRKIVYLYALYFEDLYVEAHKKKNTDFFNNPNTGKWGHNIQINGKIFISSYNKLIIGNNVHIGHNAFLYSNGGLSIGDNTHLSRNITIYTSNHNYEGVALPYDNTDNPKPVTIGKNVWIGMNVCITPGVDIGDGAIIAIGATISKDVPSMSIVGNAPQQILKQRNSHHYTKLIEEKKFGGINGEIMHQEMATLQSVNGIDKKSSFFFIASSGRSGSKSIANFLSQHSEITCLHEPKNQLIRIDSEFAHKEKTFDKIKHELDIMYNSCSFIPKENVYGESDHKFSNLIHPLSILLPESKYIWLIRDAKKVVASTYSWEWFSDKEMSIAKKNGGGGNDINQWYYYRLAGNKCSNMSNEEWQSMSCFEKNCWYWAYVNKRIETQFTKLDENRKLMIKLEELTDKKSELFQYLHVPYEDISHTHTNKAKYKLYSYENWTNNEIKIFNKWCGPLMKKYYDYNY